jgi:hemoglobin-like flavoprotein
MQNGQHRRVNVRGVKRSFEWMRPCGPALVAQVLRRLTDKHPQTRALFPEQPELSKRLFATLDQVVGHLHRYQVLEPALAEAGRDALRSGARPQDFEAVREEMIDAMARLAGEDWTEDLDRDWRVVLDSIAGAMLAADESEQAAAERRLAA